MYVSEIGPPQPVRLMLPQVLADKKVTGRYPDCVCENNMGSEHRREERYPLATEAVLERKTGEQLVGRTLNVSGSGVLVALRNPILNVGEEVCCGIRLYEGKPPQSWGIGRVVRVEDSQVAIVFETAESLPNGSVTPSRASVAP